MTSDLGSKKIIKLDSDDLLKVYSNMLKAKGDGGLGLTPRTVIYTHRTLSSALEVRPEEKKVSSRNLRRKAVVGISSYLTTSPSNY
jgi:hypothetical protein